MKKCNKTQGKKLETKGENSKSLHRIPGCRESVQKKPELILIISSFFAVLRFWPRPMLATLLTCPRCPLRKCSPWKRLRGKRQPSEFDSLLSHFHLQPRHLRTKTFKQAQACLLWDRNLPVCQTRLSESASPDSK